MSFIPLHPAPEKGPGSPPRSSDIGRLDGDSWLPCTDRVQEMIKVSVNGFPAAQAQAESALPGDPGVLLDELVPSLAQLGEN